MQVQPKIKNPSFVVASNSTRRNVEYPINIAIIPEWKLSIKRFFDIVLAFIALILLSPLLLLIAMVTKLHSKGSILYSQQRRGFKNKPFTIYKFRSMVADAEKNGPALSTPTDIRITAWGKIMRRWKLDELPQLWNVLIGDMSIVGPRPERKFYIEQLKTVFPAFPTLLTMRPGLTSLGMVEFGYASNIEEMATRAAIDLGYVEKFSLLLDLRIIAKTLLLVVSGKSK